jgi:hypothetical protein
MRRTLAMTLFVLAFAVAAVYAVGGASTFSRLRARIRAFMEPPTTSQIQQAVAREQRQATADSVQREDTVGTHQAAPASAGGMLLMMGVALGAVFILLIVSTRWPASKSR